MWVCLPSGMYMPALRPAHTVPEGDNRLLQVRARRIIDLQRLKNLYLPELGDIIELPWTDYEYRAYCTHEQWAAALAAAAMDIDYVKFKEQTETKFGDKQLHNVYTSMWYTVFSKMSTKKHQNDYWNAQNQLFKRGSRRKSTTFTTTVSRSDTPLLRDLIDEGFGITQQDLDDLVPHDWEDAVPAVSRRPDGKIDHSQCDHGTSKAARRRCTNRNRNTDRLPD